MLKFWIHNKLLAAIWIASLCTIGNNAFCQTYFKPQELITQKDFFNQFELTEYIGGGGESLVWGCNPEAPFFPANSFLIYSY